MKAMLSVITMHKMSNDFNLLAQKKWKNKERGSSHFQGASRQRKMLKKIYDQDTDSAIK